MRIKDQGEKMTDLGGRFEEALLMAHQMHKGQVRKGTQIPYISHLLAVAAIVLEHGGSEDEAIAALLHDAIEDQGGCEAREAIREKFGEKIASIVSECSDTDQSPKPPWEQRKRDYLAHLSRATKSARLVSAADKLHNARSILTDYRQQGAEVWERFNGKKYGTLWYYRSLVEEFQKNGPKALAQELEQVVQDLNALITKNEPA